MGLDSKAIEREIDGVTYKVWPIPFGVGRPVLIRLLGVLSPVLAGVFKASTKEGMAAAVFDSLPSVLSDADLSYFSKVFGDAAQFKNERGDWQPLVEKNQGDHFAGRYLAFFQWIVLACEVNYASFFAGIKNGASADGLLRMMTPK